MAQTPSPADGKKGETQGPEDVHHVVHDVRARTLKPKGSTERTRLAAAGTASPSACHLSNLRQALQTRSRGLLATTG